MRTAAKAAGKIATPSECGSMASATGARQRACCTTKCRIFESSLKGCWRGCQKLCIFAGNRQKTLAKYPQRSSIGSRTDRRHDTKKRKSSKSSVNKSIKVKK
jgi:hypothetical protein